jgi:hypothetical protein
VEGRKVDNMRAKSQVPRPPLLSSGRTNNLRHLAHPPRIPPLVIRVMVELGILNGVDCLALLQVCCELRAELSTISFFSLLLPRSLVERARSDDAAAMTSTLRRDLVIMAVPLVVAWRVASSYYVYSRVSPSDAQRFRLEYFTFRNGVHYIKPPETIAINTPDDDVKQRQEFQAAIEQLRTLPQEPYLFKALIMAAYLICGGRRNAHTSQTPLLAVKTIAPENARQLHVEHAKVFGHHNVSVAMPKIEVDQFVFEAPLAEYRKRVSVHMQAPTEVNDNV